MVRGFVMVNVLIVGGAGFIGSHLVRDCLSRGDKVTVLTRASTDIWRIEDILDRLTLVRLNLTDTEALMTALRHQPPQRVFLLGAVTRFATANNDLADVAEAMRVNLDPLRAILEALGRMDVPPQSVVRTGTLAELSSDPGIARSATREWPETTYGLSILAGTHYLRIWRDRCGIPAVTARLSLTYGGGQSPDFLVPGAIRQGLAGTPMMPRQPDARRDLIHVDDVIEALQLVADNADRLPPVVNVSTGRPIRTGDLAARIARLTGHKPPPEPAKTGAGNRVSAPPSKELRALGWRPRVSLQQGLRQVIAWERARKTDNRHPERRSA
ncbi:NAD-dependent epimerase/dehydratase family protein [Paracoccus xiamenensis]|uniref:NAD-dependent epimerase/dehydratase family protein n=1 Tax=Paracoccus xiamenensis TaxID=2714901 RepID=UPI00140DA4E2|nr:NAD(P)-dependent oxidoreductase [Paracoccus xiamenensis]NHF73034.1 NAD(P)-dependent oxidoreductase [Paracoccus xiamenensis]